jgi:phospholipid/cholesterol/gamma-HCH transport system substrate-binding protein
MAKQRNALRAGIFMLVSLALILVIIVAITGASKFTESFNSYPIAFNISDDIGGLRVSDDVRIGGLKVGDVRDISVDQDKQSVIVTIDIPAKYVVGKDANVSVQRGLTGTAAINFDSLGTGPAMAPGEFLTGRPDQLSGLFHMLSTMKPDIKAVVANLKTATEKVNTDLDKFGVTADSFSATGFAATDTVQGLRVHLPEIVDRINTLLDTARQMVVAVRDFFGPSSNDFRQTLVNLNHITGSLRDHVPTLLDQIHVLVAKLDGAVDHAAGALTDIQETANNLQSATRTIRSVLTDNHGKLDAIIAGLKSTSDNLKYASVEIRHSPWRLLYQPKPGEVANLNIYDSVRQFAEAASSLDNASTSLRDTLKDPNADPEQVKKLMAHLDDSFAKFQQVQAKLWNEIKE